MKKTYIKLIALSLMLALSVSMVVVVSYAWMVLSNKPEVAGIQVTIGGRNTILVAADVTKTVDGVIYHYPDYFTDKLIFGRHESYRYLRELDSLMPVSTADGIHWFLPEYYDSTDAAVRNGTAAAGQLKDISLFTLEEDLAHANLSGAEEDVLAEGSYAYLDFWVVSPGSDCTLRVSVPTMEGDNSGGSFLLEQMQPRYTGGQYGLTGSDSQAAAMVRVGFLTNTDTITDDTMVHYLSSPFYKDSYRSLRGSYSEPGDFAITRITDRFTIYEPNADYHPGGAAPEGTYVPTDAIALVDDVPTAVSVMDRVMAQKRSSWSVWSDGRVYIEEIFRTAVHGRDLEVEEMADYFYNQYLQGQVSPYVDMGRFYKRTSDLASYQGTVAADQKLDTAGAVDDVYIIELERNVPQRIRMFIWLEGQDVDCTNLSGAASLILNLEFAGSTE